MEALVIGLVTAIAGLWLGSIERRLRALDAKQCDTPSRREVRETIDMKQESVKVLQQEIKEDLADIKDQVERLIDLLIARNRP